MKNKNGFTLIELLVVVLIIGILAAIALPQYRIAVTKAKVASILPLMRNFKDALMEWKLTHGSYYKDESTYTPPSMSDIGVTLSDDWTVWGESTEFENDYWYCFPNEEVTGYVHCDHDFSADDSFIIFMFQSDEEAYQGVAGMMICDATGPQSNKLCQALGGKLLNGITVWREHAYRLN